MCNLDYWLVLLVIYCQTPLGYNIPSWSSSNHISLRVVVDLISYYNLQLIALVTDWKVGVTNDCCRLFKFYGSILWTISSSWNSNSSNHTMILADIIISTSSVRCPRNSLWVPWFVAAGVLTWFPVPVVAVLIKNGCPEAWQQIKCVTNINNNSYIITRNRTFLSLPDNTYWPPEAVTDMLYVDVAVIELLKGKAYYCPRSNNIPSNIISFT